jgi:hypothetical protein
MAKEKEAVTAENKPARIAFAKTSILSMNRYAWRRDILGALLTDGRSYTLAEVDAKLEKFLKGKVT